jgi:hypothetical protein
MTKMHVNLGFLKGAGNLMKPKHEVGGLEITDTAIAFLRVNDQMRPVQQQSLRLPAGVMQEGRILRPDVFAQALKALHARIVSSAKKDVPVIVSMTDAHVYTQTFTLPKLQDTPLKEAVRLNMQTISPLEFSKVYADWQAMPSEEGARELEIVASFVEKGIVDALQAALANARFMVLAIEQKAVALTRVMAQSNAVFAHEQSHFLLQSDGDGMSFSIVRKGCLYFNRFVSWEEAVRQAAPASQGAGVHRQLTYDEFKALVVREMNQLSNFYTGRVHDPVNSVCIDAPGFEDQIAAILKTMFPFRIDVADMRPFGIGRQWNIAAGSALRGIIERSKDTQISLTPEGTEEQYQHLQVISFIELWRNIVLVTLPVVLVAFVGVMMFLSSYTQGISREMARSFGDTETVRVYDAYKSEASSFNAQIARALQAQSQRMRWEPLLSELYAKTGSFVIIDRITAQSSDAPLTISARTTAENYAVEFKEALQKVQYVTDVDLSPSSMTRIDANTISFRVTFRVKGLSF